MFGYHIRYLDQVQQNVCPVCRGTLEGSKLDINTLNSISAKQQADKDESNEILLRRTATTRRVFWFHASTNGNTNVWEFR